ncbi:MAG: protein TolR [Alphaproteobacteria bacterium]|nr:protein TolR [Alphaproteobacteria bacterium]
MGAGGARAGGYTRRNARRRSSHGAISEINVTPLVDVMLVLLIVFMVAAPLMTVGVPIELPKTEAKPMNQQTEPLTISVQADRKVYVQEAEIPLGELAAKLQALVKNGNQEQLMVRADTSVPYGAVMEVMGVLNAAGYTKIGLVTYPKDKASPAK